MGQIWKEDYLGFVLVPSGFLIMLGYHVFHLHRCIKLPQTTVIGYENYKRKAWVQRVLQTARSFILANFLISITNCQIPVADVESAVIKARNFWVIGLRSLYFATNLLLWIFGPIPMFLCSVIMVVMLHFLDTNSAPRPQYNTTVINGYFEKFDKEMSELGILMNIKRDRKGSKWYVSWFDDVRN